MKVLGIETHMKWPPVIPKKGEQIGVLLPPGTEVKRGDLLIFSKENKSLTLRNPQGAEAVCKTAV